MIPVYYIANVLVLLVYIFFWILSFIIFYHLTRFGIGILPKRFAAAFFAGSIGIFIISVLTYTKASIDPFLNLFI